MAYTQQCKAELCRMLPNVPNLEAAADRLLSRMECQVKEEEDRLFDGRRILSREEENDVLVMMVDSLIEKTNGDNGKRNCCFAICDRLAKALDMYVNIIDVDFFRLFYNRERNTLPLAAVICSSFFKELEIHIARDRFIKEVNGEDSLFRPIANYICVAILGMEIGRVTTLVPF